jgi:hypothetical protein
MGSDGRRIEMAHCERGHRIFLNFSDHGNLVLLMVRGWGQEGNFLGILREHAVCVFLYCQRDDLFDRFHSIGAPMWNRDLNICSRFRGLYWERDCVLFVGI